MQYDSFMCDKFLVPRAPCSSQPRSLSTRTSCPTDIVVGSQAMGSSPAECNVK